MIYQGTEMTESHALPRWAAALALFVMLMLMYGGWYPGANEEVYLTLAMEQAGSFEGGDILSQGQYYGTSFAFNNTAGHLLKYFGLETGRIILLVLIGLLFSWNLVRIVDAVQRRKGARTGPEILLYIAVFILLGQAIVGEEWIFLGVESKAFAYVFLLYSLRYVLERKLLWAVIAGSLVMPFHILVGGWWLAVLFPVILFDRHAGTLLRRIGILLPGLIIPAATVVLLLLSHPEVLSGSGNPVANEIYVKLRNPHHLTLFWPIGPFIYERFPAFVFYVISIAAGFLLGRHTLRNDHLIAREYGFVMIALSAVLTVTLIVSLVDIRFMVSKYYLFRLAALHLLLTIVGLGVVLRQHFGVRALLPAGYALIALVVAGMALRNGAEQRNSHEESLRYAPMIEYIRGQTPDEARLLVLSEEDIDRPLSFTRKAQRRRYVLHKMPPALAGQIIRWYDRIQLKQRILDGETELIGTLDEVEYILSDRRLDERPAEYAVKGLYLYSR